jgi:thioredoxin-related protein
MHLRALILTLILVCGPACLIRASDTPPAPIYAVEQYDPKRDPAEDLKRAIRQAKPERRRILIVVGGDWCAWCRRLDTQFKQAELASLLATRYVVMKVNYSDENGNLFFLQDYPDIDEFPHFYVLDAQGKLLHSQANRVFERRGGFRTDSLKAFLKKWADEKLK